MHNLRSAIEAHGQRKAETGDRAAAAAGSSPASHLEHMLLGGCCAERLPYPHGLQGCGQLRRKAQTGARHCLLRPLLLPPLQHLRRAVAAQA